MYKTHVRRYGNVLRNMEIQDLQKNRRYNICVFPKGGRKMTFKIKVIYRKLTKTSRKKIMVKQKITNQIRTATIDNRNH